MSVAAYIAGDKVGLRMPAVDRNGRDSMGIRYEGAVLSGRAQVERELRESGWPAGMNQGRPNRYPGVVTYDLVLRAHCRTDRQA